MSQCYRYEATHYVRNRHVGECDGSECSGCQPCEERHCPECSKATHLSFGENTCPACIGRVRAALHDILDLCAQLPEEAIVRGINSEAAMLNGASADVEAFAWRRAARAAREDVLLSSLEADDEHHPANVLGRWVVALGEDYGDPTDLTITVSRAVDYLDKRLGRIAHDAGQDFGQFRREVGKCRAHLEAVLHAGLQRDTGAPCMTCEIPLVREWGRMAAADGWRCPKCKEFRSNEDYKRNVAEVHLGNATELTDRDMQERTGVRAGTVRVWAKRGYVKRRQDSGRTLYSVADVEARLSADEDEIA